MMTNRPRWVNSLFKRYLHAFHIRLSTHDWCCNRERCKYPCGLTAGYGWSSNDWPTADLWRSFRNIEARLSKQNNLTMPTWHSAVIFWKWITHWGRDKMAAISQTTVSSAFLLTITFEMANEFSLKCVPYGPIDNMTALIQKMLRYRVSDKPLPEPILVWFTDACMRHSASMSYMVVAHTI